jgi:large subunit ribosomal protein L33
MAGADWRGGGVGGTLWVFPEQPVIWWRSVMAKGKKKLEVVHLVCEQTGDHNYTIRKKSGGEKLKVKKYSPRLRKHTVHNEKKK